jgi:imidazole glycerol-phosphate synthase subunit HisF
MNSFRIIPKIEVKQFNLVKGYKLEGLRVLGSPLKYIKEYEKSLADEIILEDVMASILDSLIEKKLIKSIVENTSIALSAGGGVKNIKDADKIFACGADKIVLCTSAIKTPNLIKDIIKKYGSQSVAVKLEIYSKNDQIKYFTFYNGREVFKCSPYEWIKNLTDLGVGEFHINFIDDDGTGKALNISLFKKLRSKIEVPIIYSGGIASLQDIKLVKNSGADGVAIASALHYNLLPDIFDCKDKDKDFYFNRKRVLDDIGNYEWLINGYGLDQSSMVPNLSLKEIKKYISSGRDR